MTLPASRGINTIPKTNKKSLTLTLISNASLRQGSYQPLCEPCFIVFWSNSLHAAPRKIIWEQSAGNSVPTIATGRAGD